MLESQKNTLQQLTFGPQKFAFFALIINMICDQVIQTTIKSCYYCRQSHAMLSLIKHIFLLDYGHLAIVASRSNAKELRIAVSFQIDKVRLAMLSRRESGGSRARAPVKESMTCAGATNVFAAAHCAERNPLRPPRPPAPQSAPPAPHARNIWSAHTPPALL